MKVTIIGASDAFARRLAIWAVDAGHNVSIVGFNLAQAVAGEQAPHPLLHHEH